MFCLPCITLTEGSVCVCFFVCCRKHDRTYYSVLQYWSGITGMAWAPPALYQRRQPSRNHLKGLDRHTHTQTLNINTFILYIVITIPEVNIAQCWSAKIPLNSHPDVKTTLYHTYETHTFVFLVSFDCSPLDSRRQAGEHGCNLHSPVSPGQPQSWPPGTTKNQQAVVPQLFASRTSPQTLRCAGIQRGGNF